MPSVLTITSIWCRLRLTSPAIFLHLWRSSARHLPDGSTCVECGSTLAGNGRCWSVSMRSDRIARRFLISGEVQGVGFRYFAQRSSARHQVRGYAKNLPDGRVEVWAEGAAKEINEFRMDLAAGPAHSNVT